MSAAYIHPTAIVDETAVLGEHTKVWHFCHVMKQARIGERCVLGQNVMVGPGVVLGNGVKVQNNVSLYTGVEVEDDVFLGPSMVFTNVFNPRSGVERKDQFRKTFVKKGVTIGANATIVCGITLHPYAFIGAGSVVTKDVPSYALVYGNPAKQHGWMSAHGCALSFDAQGLTICPESGEKYQLIQGQVIPIQP